MGFVFRLLLSLFEKEGENYVTYAKGLPVVGGLKILFCEVDKTRPASGIKGGIDFYASGSLGIWRITICES